MHPGPVAPAWVAALTTDSELTFVDVSPILIDGFDSLRAVLSRRCGTLLGHHAVSTAVGDICVYSHDRRLPAPEHPHNVCAQRLLRRLGLWLDYCPGTYLFLGGSLIHEAGLSASQVDLLRNEHLICAPTPRPAPPVRSGRSA
jgi:hypothetical protein